MIVAELAPGMSKDVYVLWTPSAVISASATGLVNVHGCVRVEIDSVQGESSTANNRAQENIAQVEVVQGGATLMKSKTKPYLVIDSESMQVKSHDGRHRVKFFEMQGNAEIPVVLIFKRIEIRSDGKYAVGSNPPKTIDVDMIIPELDSI